MCQDGMLQTRLRWDGTRELMAVLSVIAVEVLLFGQTDCSWNYFHCSVSADILMNTSDALVSHRRDVQKNVLGLVSCRWRQAWQLLVSSS